MRELFDIPKEVCYLNCAYMSPLARPVVEAGMRGMKRKSRPWEISPADFFTETDACRERFARLVKAGADDISIAPSVSYGITLASANVDLGPGRSVAVLADQFPSNVYAWQELAMRRGGQVETVTRSAGQDWTGAVVEALETGRFDVAALPHCHWTDGALLDLDVISETCRRQHVALVLDVTQSLGALPLDVSRIRPDFLVCATYKWLMGPYGMALVYARPDRQRGDPIEHSWITRSNAEDFRALVSYVDGYLKGARRYDVGERSNFAVMPMAIRALDLVLEWDPEHVQRSLSRYTGEIEQAARALGLVADSVPVRAGHFLGLRFPDGLPAGAVEALGRQNIHVSARGDSLRVTPHLYNDESDKDRFVDALESMVRAGPIREAGLPTG